MSQASSATFSVSSSGATPLPIPQKPLFQDFQFKIIGKEPALLMRLSNNMVTHLDDLDMDDIYEDLPSPSSSSMPPSIPSGRPTLFQTLAGDDELGVSYPDDPAAMDVVNSSSLPASIQTISMAAPDFPKPLPNTGTHSGILRLWTSSDSPGPELPITTCTAGPSTYIQDSERSDRENRTRTTSPNDLVLSPSSHDLRPVNSFKALKKVVVLKDKFRAVSATARQCQRLAKHALINAQRSAAAAQSCLAAAESFVPCVGDVISAIRRMRPGGGDNGPASEWIAVLRDLEDDLYDLKQWTSLDTSRREASGQNLPHLQKIHLSPSGEMVPATCNGFPLTSVEEEAQEALRAWNQLDRQNDGPADGGKARREPDSRSDGISPETHIQPIGMEAEAEVTQKARELGNLISEELGEGSTGDLNKDRERREQENSQAGGWPSEEAGAAVQPRREVEEAVRPEIATGAAEDSEIRHDSRDDHMKDQPAHEKSHHSPGSRGEETVPISTTVSSDIGDVTSMKTLADCLQPGSASSQRDTFMGHIQAISKPQENVSVSPYRDAQAAFATPIAEDDAEQVPAPACNPVSPDDMQAEHHSKQPSSLSGLQGGVSVAPQNEVYPTDSTSATHGHSPILITTTSSSSEVVASDGGLGKMLSKITPEARTSDRLRDASCMSPIKTEPVEPQVNLDLNKPVDKSPASNEFLAKAVEVKSASNIPLKPDLEVSAVSVPLNSSPDECEIGRRPSARVSSIDLPAPLPDGPPAMKQKPTEADIPPSFSGAVASHSVNVVAARLTSPNNVANTAIPALPTNTPALSNSPASPSSRASQASASQLAPMPTSGMPLALRVENPTSHPNHIRDFDDSISPDLMVSRGWDADENDGSRRGNRRSPNNRFERMPRSRSRDVESRNQYVDHRSMALPPRSHLSSRGSRVSKSPDGRRSISAYEYPAPLIGKKRPREEVNHPFPPRSRRDWSGSTFPPVSENQMYHVSQVTRPHSTRLGPFTPPIAQPGYNSNNSLRIPVPSLINRLDPSSTSTMEVLDPQRSYRPQQPPQNPPWQNVGYNHGHPSPYSRQSHHGYDNDQPPELLNRITNSQQFQHDHNSSHLHSNVGRPSTRPHGRGRGQGVQGVQGGAFQQQRFQRKPPSLYDRLDIKP